MAKLPPHRLKPVDFDDFLLWATLGVVIGGRLGYVLFYKPDYYLANPSEVLFLWRGGMSFHGGLPGVLAAIGQLGSASCRERVCQFRLISVVPVSLNKKKHIEPQMH